MARTPTYTPKILSILEREHVPATFFVIGENALDHPELLRRIISDGSEIGNHSYTHPNLAEESPFGTKLELNATQRLIEAYTGRSTRLFRAPYFGDAEPTTADELTPAVLAQRSGYTIVGLHVDPADWRNPGVPNIVDSALRQVASASPQRSENILLMHDGGGVRSQTVAALPILIERLRAQGYHFVQVSQLAGLSRDAVMPPVTGKDRASVMADVAAFVALAGISYALHWLFFFAIALGFARAIFLTALALIDRKTSERPPQSDYLPTVSVIIPAYNEEKVIVSSIARVLESDYPSLELIVADDGSKDRTSALVTAHYGSDPRVRLLTLSNGGKASALNRALAQSSGEILIALDADTQFLPDTISRLVRWFADPAIGAVAGNARVGNRDQSGHALAGHRICHRAECRTPRAGCAGRDNCGAGCGRRLAAARRLPRSAAIRKTRWQRIRILRSRSSGWAGGWPMMSTAIALTEAPETLRALGKQRYRWSFGTLQCLWKHRAVLGTGRPRGLAWFGIAAGMAVPDPVCRPLADHRPCADPVDHRHGGAGSSSTAWPRPRAMCCAWRPIGSPLWESISSPAGSPTDSSRRASASPDCC